MTERLPCPPAPGPLRQVRGWLDPWTFLWRCWRAWSNAPRLLSYAPSSMPSARGARSTSISAA